MDDDVDGDKGVVRVRQFGRGKSAIKMLDTTPRARGVVIQMGGHLYENGERTKVLIGIQCQIDDLSHNLGQVGTGRWDR